MPSESTTALATRLMMGTRALPAATAERFLLRLKRSDRDLFGPLEVLYGNDPSYGQFREDLIKTLISLQKIQPRRCAALTLPAIRNPTGSSGPTASARGSTSTASTRP